MLAGAAAAQLPKQPPIEWRQTQDGHEARLLLYEQRGMVRLGFAPAPQGDRAVPMAKRATLWKPLLEQMFRERGHRSEYLLAVGQYPELEARIAIAAADSGRWDPGSGRVRTGDAAAFVKELLTEKALWPEIASLFESLGYRLAVHSVESVVLCKGSEIQCGPPACRASPALPPDSTVPCGASVLFRLTRDQRR
jgi:hypothetical protein